MSKRDDIIDGSLASARRNGLIYTCHLGWIDLGHARPDGAKALWLSVSSERGTKSKDGKGFKVKYSQEMAKYLVSAGVSKEYYVRCGLSHCQKESVALSIFLETSFEFEALQSSFPYNWVTDSGFSAEDLVSNLLGFYRAVRPSTKYLSLSQPVTKDAAIKIWDEYGAVGSNKNRSISPSIYPCSECSRSPGGPECTKLPDFLAKITPATKGDLFRNWDSNKD